MATTDAPRTHGQATGPVELAIVVCSAVFIAGIFIALYLGASIRTLFWSLPCVVASVLCVRRTKFGYALGVASGAVGGLFTGGWSLTFLFVRHGMPVPATVSHVLTAVATMGLVFFSLVGYARLPKKSWGDTALFIAAIILVGAFLFLATFAGMKPMPRARRLVGLIALSSCGSQCPRNPASRDPIRYGEFVTGRRSFDPGDSSVDAR